MPLYWDYCWLGLNDTIWSSTQSLLFLLTTHRAAHYSNTTFFFLLLTAIPYISVTEKVSCGPSSHQSSFFFFFPFHWRCIFVWIQQRVQLSWTQTGTLGRRQTASLSWPFTLTQTAVGAGVEVWEMVTPTARGALGVRRTHTPTDNLSHWWYCHRHDAWQVNSVHVASGWF